MTESESALATAKTRRADSSTALQVAAVSASADVLDVDVCKAHVAAVEQARAAAITAAKPEAAMKADSTLLTARITLEIAAARAAASTAKHTAAVAADIAMKTLSLRMTEPVRTMDAARYSEDSLGEALANLEGSIGLLEPGDLSRIKAILQKYCGGSASVTNATGITRAGDEAHADAVDAARKSAAAVAGNISHNQSVAAGYRDFWHGKNRELRDSITR
jgi:trimeric autotransporter adhesin